MESNNTKELVIFFIITYIFSWLLWLPAVLYLNGLIDGSLEIYYTLGMLAPFGPMVAAFILTLKSKGMEGVKKGIKKGLNIRLGWWWIPILILVPIIALIAHTINIFVLGGYIPIIAPIIMIPMVLLVTLLIGGPLAEEFGWRGYAKPRLEEGLNTTSANIILGLIWGFWHLPLFFMIGFPHHDYFPLWLFIINCVVFSLLIAYFQNNTEKLSVVPALIIHTWMNTIMEIMPLMEFRVGGNYNPWLISLIIIGVMIILIFIKYGADLTKNKQI